MNSHVKDLMDEYFADFECFEIIRDFVLKKIKELLDEEGILVTTFEGRVKAPSSLEGKLELKGYKYNTLSDITDLFGARIVTFYTDDVDRIASIVSQTFDIDWDNSVDKRKLLDTDQFGYMSLHYICRIPKALFYDETHPKVNEYRFEIQMRTALQHVWATVYHDAGYKTDIEVPKEYLRGLSRLAGLLEIADIQFSEIISNLDEYKRKVKALVANGDYRHLELNRDTFSSYLELAPFDKLVSRTASINKAEIQHFSFFPFLPALKKIGFQTLGDVDSLIENYSEDAYKLARLSLKGKDIDIISNTLALHNLCYVYLVENGGGMAGIRSFLDEMYGERPYNASSAKRIYEQVLSLNSPEGDLS